MNLPVQSGSDRVLFAMRRGYTVARYRELVAAIRQEIPAMAITTDVIVGFPGETEADFAETMSLLRDLRFDQVHVATYSPRPGTIAARELTDDVPPEAKAARLQAVEALQIEVAAAINAPLCDTTVEVLISGRKGAKWQGRTITDKIVFLDEDSKDYYAQLVSVRINRTSPWALSGRVVSGVLVSTEEGK
jgi:tRNA-2-methylthio-N6-dimethylallyladenosine synthase